jgi:hypothetical protein
LGERCFSTGGEPMTMSKLLLLVNVMWIFLMKLLDHAITQAVSRRLPTATIRVRAQVRSCMICGTQTGTGVCFLRVLRFPMEILIPPTARHSSSPTIRGWYNRPNSGQVDQVDQVSPHTKK